MYQTKYNIILLTQWSHFSVNTRISKTLYGLHSPNQAISMKTRRRWWKLPYIKKKKPSKFSNLIPWQFIFCVRGLVLIHLSNHLYPKSIFFYIIYNSRGKSNLSYTDQFLCFKKEQRCDYSHITNHIQGIYTPLKTPSSYLLSQSKDWKFISTWSSVLWRFIT